VSICVPVRMPFHVMAVRVRQSRFEGGRRGGSGVWRDLDDCVWGLGRVLFTVENTAVADLRLDQAIVEGLGVSCTLR